MLQNWIGSLGRILTRKPPRFPKGEVSMHGKIRDIQWVQEAQTENASNLLNSLNILNLLNVFLTRGKKARSFL